MRERPAPEIVASAWLNTSEPLSLETLKGRVVILYAFQQKCEGCLHSALPQAKALHAEYSSSDLAVIGLHCPFAAASLANRGALEEFILQQGITFPVAMDADGPLWEPETFARYGMQGTPAVVLIGRNGKRRLQHLGTMNDGELRQAIQTLLSEPG